MQPVQGHPYVMAQVAPTPYGDHEITCHCRFCGDVWRHRCQFAPKAPAWVARYGALHSHGDEGLRQRFARRYHMALQSLRRF